MLVPGRDVRLCGGRPGPWFTLMREGFKAATSKHPPHREGGKLVQQFQETGLTIWPEELN